MERRIKFLSNHGTHKKMKTKSFTEKNIPTILWQLKFKE